MNRRRPTRAFLRVFSAFYVVFAMTFTTLAVWSIADEHRGSEAVAKVMDVERRGARTYVTVEFSTSRGEMCEADFRVAVDANRGVTTGERIPIHYANTGPCYRVREVDDQSRWFIMVIGVVLLIAATILAYIAWRRPRPSLPLRYAGMP